MLISIHERLKNVYNDKMMAINTVTQWVPHCNETEVQSPLGDELWSSRPVTVGTIFKKMDQSIGIVHDFTKKS